MPDHSTIVYLGAVAASGLTLALMLRVWFARGEQRRKNDIEGLKKFVAVKVPSHAPTKKEKFESRALQSIETRFSVMRRLTIPFVLVVTIVLLSLPFIGRIPAAFLTVLATAATVILGIAAKPILENVIAGLMVSFSQPIRIGDLVTIQDKYGIVEEINLTYTVIKLWDYRRFVLPNNRLLQVDYINYSLFDRWQWAYVSFWVDHAADPLLVERLAIAAVKDSPHNSKGQEPGFWIMENNKEGVVCWIAGWVDHPLDAWSLRHEVSTRLIKSMQEHGIRTHLFYHDGAAGMAGTPLCTELGQ